MARAQRYSIDMTSGNLLPKILRFALPLVLTSMLQLLYNAADVIVVGRFAGAEALAAVGSTGALINLIVNLFFGLSIGANVIVARDYGAGDIKGTQQAVHTSVLVSIIGGALLAVFGYLYGGTFLTWMQSPPEVLPLATVYIRIFFLGMPFNMLYNFGAAILRAVGDTKRPLYFLTVSGIINVALNLFFVIRCGMGVAGVAWATIISQAISAVLVLLCLIRSEGFIRLDIKKLAIHPKKLLAIMAIGIPAGFQSTCFSVSNVLIQSAVNRFGAIVVAGNAASANLEGFVYVGMNAFYQACITFVSANVGARKNSRIFRVMGACLFLVTVVGLVLGGSAVFFGNTLLSLYSTDPAVITAGTIRLAFLCAPYFLCGVMEVLCGTLRGMGSSFIPMIVSIFSACVLRIVWIYYILPPGFDLYQLYLSYPISWFATCLVHFLCICIRKRKFPNEVPEPVAA